MFKLLLILSILSSTPELQDANVATLVYDYQTGDTIDAYRANCVIPPASTIKLLTTATIVDHLGSDYQIATPITYSGYIEDNTLHGNLYIEGKGDPTLGSQYVGDSLLLQHWAEQIYNAGIHNINGSIVADVSYFDAEATNPAWIWQDIGNYYAPGIQSLSYKDNTMKITLESGAVGSLAKVLRTDPTIPEMQFDSYTRCENISYDGAYVYGMPYSNYRYIAGKIPANRSTFTIKGDLPNPALLLVTDLANTLITNGISVNGDITFITEQDTTKTTRTLLFQHKSAPLSEIIRHTNHKSDNLYAEMLYRILGTRQEGSCTINQSTNFIRTYWGERGVDLSSARIMDGCGLAPQDAISPSMFIQLLRYMYESPNKDSFIASLPCSGKSGTLKSFLKNTSLHGRVYAKSGTIGGTKNYTGYIFLPDGRVWIFAVMINSANCSSRTMQNAIEKYLLDVYTRNT